MAVIKTAIEGVFIIEPTVYGDERGYFFESYNEERFRSETGIDVHFVQDNESKSKRGVLRGFHFQRPPHAQAKLVRVVSGTVVDVAVDIRTGSPTYGKHVAVELSEDNHRQLFLPRGMAHGFVVKSDEAIFQYKCDNYYHPESEGGIAWNDPTIAMDWGVAEADITLSDKDRHNPTLEELGEIFEYGK